MAAAATGACAFGFLAFHWPFFGLPGLVSVTQLSKGLFARSREFLHIRTGNCQKKESPVPDANATLPGVALPKGRGMAQRSVPALRTIAALVLREMSTRFGRKPGGY